MASLKLISVVAVIALSCAASANPAVYSSNDGLIEQMRSSCSDGSDPLSCVKFRVMNFLDTIFKKDNYQVSDDVEVRHNGFTGEDVSARSGAGFIDIVQGYLSSHDVTFKLPIDGAKVTVSPRNINDDELSLKINYAGEGRKSKLKKIALPIMVFVLLKAMTLVPLALGVLGLKAWNALQLSFFSFVISIGLAIFQLCKKLALDHHHHPHIAAHGPWDAARSFVEVPAVPQGSQGLAYNAYV